MKCGSCGEEVAVQLGKSANFCSNCGNKIETEKAGGWKYFDSTKELLEYVAAKYGNDALFGRKYFSDHTSPMMPQGQKNLVKQAFECGAVKILQDNMAADQQRREIAVKQAIKKLVDAFLTAQDAAECIVWEFTNAIGWGLPQPNGEKEKDSDTPPPKPGVPIGSIYRFGGSEWKVLDTDSGKILLISKDILEKRPYHNEFVSTSWAECDLRKYLNDEFYNSFVPKDRARILRHDVTNDDNPWWDTPGGENTQDYIWLLSLEEVCRYFGNSEEQLSSRTKRALAQQIKRDYWDKGKVEWDEWKEFYLNNKIYVDDENSKNRVADYGNEGASWWWLRSPGTYSNLAAIVRIGGYVFVLGGNVFRGSGGVRPALWLNLESAIF